MLDIYINTWYNTIHKDPFRELIVHHEIMHVLLGPGEFKFASQHCYHERRTPGTLRTT